MSMIDPISPIDPEGDLDHENDSEVETDADQCAVESFNADDVAALYRDFPVGDPERERTSSSLSNEERASLAARGVLGPASLREDRFRTSPRYNEQVWHSKLGRLDAMQEARPRLEDLARLSEQLPDPSNELQRACYTLGSFRPSLLELAPFHPIITAHRIRSDGGMDTVEWTTGKEMRFLNRHPDEYEEGLLRAASDRAGANGR